jgi:hypothetical protein
MSKGLVLVPLALLFVAASGPSAHAQAGDGFGLGLIIGDPTGLSGKGFVSQTNAIDFAVGFSFINDDHLHVHADYLWHFDSKRGSSAQLDLHLGVGPTLGMHYHEGRGTGDDWIGIGARGPFGLTMAFLEAPFDIFVEIAAGLWLVPDPNFDLDAAIGGRFWF